MDTLLNINTQYILNILYMYITLYTSFSPKQTWKKKTVFLCNKAWNWWWNEKGREDFLPPEVFHPTTTKLHAHHPIPIFTQPLYSVIALPQCFLLHVR